MKIKRKVFVSIAMAFFVLTLLAAAAFAMPQTISYQGRLAESGGAPVNGPVSMTFAIYNAPSAGSALWTETQSNVTVTDGAFSVVLGSIYPITLPFDEQYYLGVQVEADAEMSPRALLVSVPYAMRAKEVDNAPAHFHTGSDITSGTVSVARLNTTVEVQRRVAESCAPGYMIRAIEETGGVACEFDDDTTYTPGTGIDITGTQINNIGDTDSSDDLTVGTTFSGDVTGTYNALNIASGAVTSAEIADGTITGTDITDGTIPSTKLIMPLALSASSASPTLRSSNTGTGRAGSFQIDNSNSSQTALYAQTTGSGPAVYAYNNGTGRAGYFMVFNAANAAPSLYASTIGTGYSGYFTGGAGLYVNGNLNVTGSITGDGSSLTGVPVGTHGHSGADITSGTVADANIDSVIARDSEIMPTVLANDGTGSTLNADLLDGQNSTAFAASAHGHSGSDITDGTVTSAKLSLPITLSGSIVGLSLVSSTNSGGGRAGSFTIDNTGTTAVALGGETNGVGPAVRGYTTGTGDAGYFWINNVANGSNAIYARTSGSGAAVYGYTTGLGYSGYFTGGAGLYVNGILTVTGVKNFVQPHPTDPTKQIAYVAMEAPESAVMIRGKAKLVEGRAVIETPEYFRLVAGLDEDITVQFTPRSSRSKGLAAVKVSKEEIRVEELLDGAGTYEFDYFITAKRAGFEGHEPIQPNTHFTADMKTAEEFEEAYAKDDMTISAMRKLLVSNGILTADGKLNMELARELGWVVKDSDVAMKEAE